MLKRFSENEYGVAIDGFDPVAYFKGAAEKGQERYSLKWRETIWRFSSEANRAAFLDSPESFVPQAGGYCALGMSLGKTAKADPRNFVIRDGQLFLLASPMVRRFWRWFGSTARATRKWD